MMFVYDMNFMTLGKRTDSQWGDLPQQHQITVDEQSGGLVLYGENMNPGKVSWYTIGWVWIYGRPIMLKYENQGEIYVTKIYY